jgi:hypothetical protein
VIRELSNIGFSVELTSIVSSSSFSSPLDLDLVLLLDAEWVLLLPRQCEFAFPSFVFSRCPHPKFPFLLSLGVKHLKRSLLLLVWVVCLLLLLVCLDSQDLLQVSLLLLGKSGVIFFNSTVTVALLPRRKVTDDVLSPRDLASNRDKAARRIPLHFCAKTLLSRLNLATSFACVTFYPTLPPHRCMISSSKFKMLLLRSTSVNFKSHSVSRETESCCRPVVRAGACASID